MSAANQTNNISVYSRPNHFALLKILRERDDLCDVTIKAKSNQKNRKTIVCGSISSLTCVALLHALKIMRAVSSSDTEIRAHRLILAASTNYFYRMFTSDFKECKKDIVLIEDVNEKSMLEIVKFSYTGEIVFTKENAVRLLRDADFFELIDVKNKCMEYLESNIEISNVCDMFYLATLLPGYNYRNVDVELLKSVLPINNSKIHVSPEIKLEAVIQWASDDVDGKKTYLPELLRYVDSSQIKVNHFARYLFGDELKESIGSNHSEFVAEVLSVFNRLESRKSYIYAYNYLGDAEIYDFKKDEWSSASTSVDAATMICHVQVLMYENQLYAFSNNHRPQIMYVYNFDDKIWINTEISIPFDTSGVSMVVLNNCIYACGGLKYTYVPSRSQYYSNVKDVWCFSFNTKTWKAVQEMTKPRCFCKLVVLDKYIYAIGGKKNVDWDEYKTPMTMERYDPQKDEWTFICDLDINVDTSYEYFGTVGLNDKIYFCGGLINNEGVALVKAYDLSTKKWTNLASMNTARCHHAVVECKGKIWVIGGSLNGESLLSVEVYDPDSNVWSYGKPMNNLKYVDEAYFISAYT